jgi:hypothetical protein
MINILRWHNIYLYWSVTLCPIHTCNYYRLIKNKINHNTLGNQERRFGVRFWVWVSLVQKSHGTGKTFRASFCCFIDSLVSATVHIGKYSPHLWCLLYGQVLSRLWAWGPCALMSQEGKHTLPFCTDSSDLGTATCCLGPEMRPWLPLESVWQRKDRTCRWWVAAG